MLSLRYWESAISSLLSCVKLLKKLQFAGYCFVSSCWVNLSCKVLCVKFQLVGYCFAPSFWGSAVSRHLSFVKLCGDYNSEAPATICRVLHCVKLLGEFQLAGYCFAPSYWEITISGLLSYAKLVGNYNLQGLSLPQAIEGLQFRGSCLVSS